MMVAVVATLSIGLFTISLFLSGLVRVSRSALSTATEAFSAIRDASLSDDQRESIVQRASVQLAVTFLSIAVRGVFTLLAAFAPIWIFHATDIVAIEETMLYLGRWDVIVVSTFAITIGLVVWHRLRNSR